MDFTPIAFLRSPYKQKFAIPRQPNLVPQARGELVFEPDFGDPNALRGIEQFSHLWLLFVFHGNAGQGWSPMVKPPRLGGRGRMGVFASRSGFRPNPIGLSVVEYDGWEQKGPLLRLRVRGVDLLDGTPILDIKPYVPWADAVPAAHGGYAHVAPPALPVQFSALAEQQIGRLEVRYPELKDFIAAVLAQDPRPAWRRREGDDKQYGMSLYDLNIKWRRREDGFEVLRVEEEGARTAHEEKA